jgi:DNA-binding NarL/FixJ family response regulator
MKATRVLIADDHEITRLGVKSILALRENYEVCGEAADGRAAVKQTEVLCPDLVILEIVLPQLNGLEAARRILSHCAQTAVLIFTEIRSEQIMRQALRAGVAGIVLKSDSAYDLLIAAEALVAGRTFVTSQIRHLVKDARKQARQHLLTLREQEVIQLLAEGNCGKEIARILGVSTKTIETHRNNLMRKLNVNSTAKLILSAIRNEIVHISKRIYSPSAAHQSFSGSAWVPAFEEATPIHERLDATGPAVASQG